MDKGLIITCLSIALILIIPCTAYGGENESNEIGGGNSIDIELGLYPSVYRFDSDFFGADLAYGIDAHFSIRIYRQLYFENIVGFYLADTENERIEGFKDQIDVRINPLEGFFIEPELTVGIAVISANPSAETVTYGFRPSQTAFYLTAGAGASMKYSERIILRGAFNILATPYSYRVYSYDRAAITQDERQFTNIQFALGASYIF